MTREKNNRLVKRLVKNQKTKVFGVFLFVITLLLSACRLGQLFMPAVPPPPTLISITNTPTPISITNTPTLTPTLTPIPGPVCKPGTTVQGTIDNELPGHFDILKVSTALDGITLTVVFTLREIPDEITRIPYSPNDGCADSGWLVSIDTDNNPNTGFSDLVNSYPVRGYGYEYSLSSFFYTDGGIERKGTIEDLYGNLTIVEKAESEGVWSWTSMTPPAKMVVDKNAQTITLIGDIEGITPDSYLHFYTHHSSKELFTSSVADELCQR